MTKARTQYTGATEILCASFGIRRLSSIRKLSSELSYGIEFSKLRNSFRFRGLLLRAKRTKDSQPSLGKELLTSCPCRDSGKKRRTRYVYSTTAVIPARIAAKEREKKLKT
ncbi:60S ribosomal protein L28 [Striga asiatica]|uniref:60S ribosomal protein L28 n=1 Tax=Striga asiatica TaxID=4170 RepID=A0A5A7PZG3_STRAF|nr:60S ribosomal protein L28 [Striga asiatica]